MSERITTSLLNMNIAITISGPIGPWTCKPRMSIIFNGRELKELRCHGCSDPIRQIDFKGGFQ